MKEPETATDNNDARKPLEETKKALELCVSDTCIDLIECPYGDTGYCVDELMKDALTHIRLLESSLGSAQARYEETLDALAQTEKERDAAVADIANYAHSGTICKHYYDCHFEEGCPLYPSDCGGYEWRGVCPENTKEDANV